MRPNKRTSLLFGLLSFTLLPMLSAAGTNTWTIKGPPGGYFRKAVVNPSDTKIMYAAYSRSLHKSADGGDTWQTIRQFKNQINEVVVEPSNGKIYVAVYTEGLFRSDDAGQSFTQIAPGHFAGPWGVAVSGSTIYYSNGDRSFYRSTNNGQTWSVRTPAPQSLTQILIEPNNVNSIFAFNGPYLLRSLDGGASWTQSSVGTLGTNVNAAVFLSPTKLAVCAGDGVYLSNDSGAVWTRNASISGCRGIAVDPNSPGTILAGLFTYFTGGPLFRSTDYGLTWSALNSVPYGPAEGIIIGSGTPAPIVVVNAQGAMRSNDSGMTWLSASRAPVASSASLSTTIAANSKVYAYSLGGTVGSAALFSSSGDSDWQRLNLSSAETAAGMTFGQASLVVKPGAPNSIYLGTFGSGLFRSDNSGSSWMRLGTGLNGFGITAMAIDPANTSTMYAKVMWGGSTPVTGIYRSTDGGSTWSPRSNSFNPEMYGSQLIIDPADSNRLFLSAIQGYYAAGTGGLYQSADAGMNWTQQFVGQDVRGVAISPVDSNRIYVAAASGLQMSTDGGTTFNSNTQFSIITSQAAGSIAIDPTVPTTLYATSLDPGYNPSSPQRSSYVLRSVDSGSSWETLRNETDSPYWIIQDLELDPNNPSLIYASTSAYGIATFEVSPDLSVTISGHSGTRAVGSQTSFDIQAVNIGPFAATAVHVVATLPSTLTGVSAVADKGTCSVTNNTVDCTIAVLKKDERVNINIVYIPPSAMSIAITAAVSGHERDMATANNAAQATAIAGEVVDLGVALVPSVVSASNGDEINYTLSVTNNGPVPASNSTAVLRPTTSVRLGAPPPGCTLSGTTMTCATGSLAVSATRTFTIPATISAPGVVTVTAEVAPVASASDTNMANNSTVATITALPTGDLSVNITDSVDPATVSTNFDYRVIVRNSGPDEMPNVVATITNAATSVAISTTQGSCTSSSSGITCNLGAIGSGATVTVTISTASSSAGTTSLRATVSSTGTDAVTTNNSAQESTAVNVPAVKESGGGGGGLTTSLLLTLFAAWLARRAPRLEAASSLSWSRASRSYRNT